MDDINVSSQLSELIRCARGETAADLLLANARVVNVFTREVLLTDVAVSAGRIAGLGRGYRGRETVDLEGRYVSPGFIDGHIHIESTMLTPARFAEAVVPRGTTAVVCDPHEIANVLGAKGVEYFLQSGEGLPLDLFIMLPSCVPANPLETSGATLDARDLERLMHHPRVVGLAEMMNFPGVLMADPGVLAKLALAASRFLPIDGHAPGVTGKDLNAYVAAGIRSDHECTRRGEALEKLRSGMYLYIREGTTVHNLTELIRVVTPGNARRCLLVSDDRHPDDLMDHGHLDHSLRLAVRAGLDPVTAIQMVTLNAAERFRLRDHGAVAPGYLADLVALDDLEDFRVSKVFYQGRLVADGGKMAGGAYQSPLAGDCRPFALPEGLDFFMPAAGDTARVIGLIEGQILTEDLVEPVSREGGLAVADPGRDILKLAVVERHRGTGNIGLGFVKGLGLKKGAIAGTVAHDSHNLVVAGTNDADMQVAAREAAEMGGGLVAVENGRVLARLALPVAGLMSCEPLEVVRRGMDELLGAARGMGSTCRNPFMSLSFLALPVIPALRLTDRGLVDVKSFSIVPIFCP
jgi:adenine deaminase